MISSIIGLVIAFLAASPFVAWVIFSDVVHIRKELAETRYFNVVADINENSRSEYRMYEEAVKQ